MRFLLLCFLLSITSIGLTQKGIHFYAGVASGVNANEIMTPEGKAHNGIFIAIETRLSPKEKFSLLGGAKYQDVNFIAADKGNLIEREQTMKWAKVRLGAMYKVVEFNQSTNIRIKGYGTGNVLMKWPDNNPTAPYDKFNAVTAGGIIGIGADIRDITIDFEYELGFLNSISDVESSTWNFWDLGIGVHF